MRANHPDATTGALSFERFCALDHPLVLYQGGSLTGVTDEALAKIGRARRVTESVTSFPVLADIFAFERSDRGGAVAARHTRGRPRDFRAAGRDSGLHGAHRLA
jgi:hypothetical protein